MNLNSTEEKQSGVEVKQLREFGLLFAAFFSLVLGTFLPLMKHRPVSRSLVAIGVFFLFLSLFAPGALDPVRRIWIRLGEKVGMLNSRIILGFVFCFLFIPLAWLFRLSGRDPLSLKFNRGQSRSYRIVNLQTNEHQNTMERPF